MRRTLFHFAIIAAASLAACAPPVNRLGAAPLSVVPIETARYAGRWFEIARFPNRFERGCAAVTAEYALQADGKIAVRNICREGRVDGPARVAKGVARIVDPASNAKLKVRFFGPFEGDYWVLDRADDYSWALVGEPRGRYLWILARAPRIDEPLRRDLLTRLEARGYRTAALEWTAQP